MCPVCCGFVHPSPCSRRIARNRSTTPHVWSASQTVWHLLYSLLCLWRLHSLENNRLGFWSAPPSPSVPPPRHCAGRGRRNDHQSPYSPSLAYFSLQCVRPLLFSNLFLLFRPRHHPISLDG